MGNNSDPASLHKYVYTHGNPINGIDPSGQVLISFDGTFNFPTDEGGTDTNVFRFRNAYDASKERKYYRGIGNEIDAWVSVHGGEPFAGATGVGGQAILRRALRDVEAAFRAGDRDIDIVGFSRGAALALAFANVLQERGLQMDGYREVPLIRFVGLFDTVAQFFPANIGYGLELPRIVQNAFHAMAFDEGRLAFPLTRVPGATERWFRGVHFDIGTSDTSLRWMIESAQKAGVPVKLPEGLKDQPWTGSANGPFRRDPKTGDMAIGFALPGGSLSGIGNWSSVWSLQ